MALTSKELAQLKKIAKLASDKYYNTDEFFKAPGDKLLPKIYKLIEPLVIGYLDEKKRGKLVITDKVYDFIEKTLKKEDPEWKPAIRAEVPKGRNKVPLPYQLGSLDKAYEGDGKLSKFINRTSGEYVVSDKLDGATLEMVLSKEGNKLYTGGDGIIGQDISFMMKHLGVPKYSGPELAIRLEAMMDLDTFVEKWSHKYKNPRNLASGILNKQGIHEALGDVNIIAHSILNKPMAISAQYALLKKLGFDVVWHKKVTRLSDSMLKSVYQKRKSVSPYNLDGVVIVEDKPHSVHKTASNPKWAIAFKENDEAVEVKVTHVEWNASKHGKLIPKVYITPVEMGGTTVTRAAGKNAKFIVENKIGKGAVIAILKGGEIIPDIVEIVKSAKSPDLPDEELGPYKWDANRVHFMLKSTTEGKTGAIVKAKQIYSFLSAGLDVEDLALAGVTKCIGVGIDSVEKFLRAKPADFAKAPGVKTKAEKWHKEIQTKAKQANLAKVAANSGFFGANFGERRVQQIMEKYDLFALAKYKESSILSKVVALRGFKETTATPFAKGLRPFIEWVSKQPIKFKAVEKVKAKGSKLKGQAVCFTEVRSKDTEKAIVEQGGTIANGVNGKTTILITGDMDSNSSKMQKAAALGIPVMTLDKFKKKYGV